MERASIWRILENPLIYRISQLVLGAVDEDLMVREIKSLLERFNHRPGPRRDLDIGCGPSSLLWRLRFQPVGLDAIHPYVIRFSRKGKYGVVGSAIALPFQDNSYDGVWNFGLLHHLSDPLAVQAMQEMVRAVRPGGHVFIFDGVMPETKWRNPIAWIIRNLDRGMHMRNQAALESLLPDPGRWFVKRLRYSISGLEGVVCGYKKL